MLVVNVFAAKSGTTRRGVYDQGAESKELPGVVGVYIGSLWKAWSWGAPG